MERSPGDVVADLLAQTDLALDLRPVWRDPGALRAVREGLADLLAGRPVDLVVGIEARGLLLGAAVASRVGCGFVEIRKQPNERRAPEVSRETLPDSRGTRHVLSVGAGLIRPCDRVALVDDWIDSGAQATAARQLVENDLRATWVGAAVVVSEADPQLTAQLGIRSLVNLWNG